MPFATGNDNEIIKKMLNSKYLKSVCGFFFFFSSCEEVDLSHIIDIL